MKCFSRRKLNELASGKVFLYAGNYYLRTDIVEYNEKDNFLSITAVSLKDGFAHSINGNTLVYPVISITLTNED